MCFETFMCITTAKYRALFNVVLLSVAFLLLLTAYTTFSTTENSILRIITRDDPSYTGNPYIASSIFYGVFATCNWAAPSIISALGPRISMIVGSFGHSFYLFQFIYPTTWLLYTSSVLLGVGAAILWTSQGYYLTINSTIYTMSKHSGVFWAIMQFSMFIGNFYIFFRVEKDAMEKDQRISLLIVLLLVSLLGTSSLLTLGTPVYPLTSRPNPLEIFISTMKLSITKDMLLLCLTFIHTGITLAFDIRIYSNVLKFTMNLTALTDKQMFISGMMIATGNISGGMICAVFGHKVVRRGRFPIIIVGFIFHFIAAILILLNFPNAATFEPTYDSGMIKTDIILAFICSFMLGFGDACYNTQIFAVLGTVFADKSCESFALYRCVQSAFTGITFSTATIGLHGIISLFILSCILGTIGFCIVDLRPTYQTDSTNDESDN